MKIDIKESVLKHFPADQRLVYNDFICDEIVGYYYRDEQRIQNVFDLISCPWTEIDWSEVSKISFTQDEDFYRIGYLVIGYLNKKSFIHVFPSMLVEVAENKSMAADYFLYHYLDVRSVFKDWVLEFYFSFDKEIEKLINCVLRENNSSWAMDAIDVYWHE